TTPTLHTSSLINGMELHAPTVHEPSIPMTAIPAIAVATRCVITVSVLVLHVHRPFAPDASGVVLPAM
ncbi:MAG TPA: hypothetical protein PLX97_03730, partial [Gemmatales bacterium]|nr:hypothetical protein [Gemmatales bacterium]